MGYSFAARRNRHSRGASLMSLKTWAARIASRGRGFLWRTAAQGEHRRGRPPPAIVFARRLFRWPLFAKILVANIAIVLLGAVAGTALTAEFVRAHPTRPTVQLILAFGGLGILISALLNALILRVALGPLRHLEAVAKRVHGGELAARAPRSLVADRDLERLTTTFNRMLDGITEYQTRLQHVTARALTAQEEERKRIAWELHDDTAQTLASLMIRLRVARSTADAELRDRRIEDVRTELAKAMEGVRRFARALRPPALDEVGVVAALREHARTLCETAGVRARVEADAVDRLLSPNAELVLYRIVQEALSNVVRHAQARTVCVRLERRHGAVLARVTDDGIGFEVDAELYRHGGGLGLFGMQERAAYVGGSVSIESEPGAGTTVRVEIPTAPESNRA